MTSEFSPFSDAAEHAEPEKSAIAANPLDRRPQVMVETAFLASTSALIWLVNFYFPIGPIFRMLFPLPTAIAFLRWGRRASWMTAIVASLLLSVLMGPPRGLQFFIPYGLLGVLLGGCWRAKRSWTVSMGWGVLLATAGFFFQAGLVSLLVGTNLWVYLSQQVRGLLLWIFEKLGVLLEPNLLAIQLVATALIAVQAMLYLLLVHLVALLLTDRLGHPIPAPPVWLQALLDEEFD